MKATGILVAFVLLPTITLVPEMAEELCLPAAHSLVLQPTASRAMNVAT